METKILNRLQALEGYWMEQRAQRPPPAGADPDDEMIRQVRELLGKVGRGYVPAPNEERALCFLWRSLRERRAAQEGW